MEYGDSIELLPRPPTPGTVNSDEILPPDYTLPSPGGTVAEMETTVVGDIRTYIIRNKFNADKVNLNSNLPRSY